VLRLGKGKQRKKRTVQGMTWGEGGTWIGKIFPSVSGFQKRDPKKPMKVRVTRRERGGGDLILKSWRGTGRELPIQGYDGLTREKKKNKKFPK